MASVFVVVIYPDQYSHYKAIEGVYARESDAKAAAEKCQGEVEDVPFFPASDPVDADTIKVQLIDGNEEDARRAGTHPVSPWSL